MKKDATSAKAADGANVIKQGSVRMRLERLQSTLREKNFPFTYTEEEGCGSVDFEYRGVSYHVWEFCDKEWGAETNVRNMGRHEDVYGDYEGKIIEIVKEWN